MAAKTWSRTVGDANWSTAANWNGGTVPATTDTIAFDATSVLNCTIDALGTWSGGTVTVGVGYTGAITQNVNMTSAAYVMNGNNTAAWTMAANLTTTTFAMTTGNITFGFKINSGNFQCTTFTISSGFIDLSGAGTCITTGNITLSSAAGTATVSVKCPSGTWETRGSWSQAGTDLITFDANGGTTSFTSGTSVTINMPSITFNLCTVNKTNSLTVSSGTTFPLGNNPTTTVAAQTFTVSGTITSTGTTWAHTGNLTFGAAGVFTSASLTDVDLNGSFTCSITGGATFPTGVRFALTGANTSTISAAGYTFGTSTVSKLTAATTTTIANGTTFPVGASPSTSVQAGTFVVTGTLTVSGAWVHTGSLTISSTTGTVSGALTSLTIDVSLTIATTATWPASVACTFNGTGNRTITNTNANILGTCTWSITGVSTLTIAASTTIPVGADANTSVNTLTVNGTITASGTWSNVVGTTLNLNATAVLSGTFVMKLNTTGSLTVNVNAAATWPATSGIEVNCPNANGRVLNLGGKTYASFMRTGSGAAAITITGTNTFGAFTDNLGLVAHTITFPNVTTTVGTFVVRGSAGKLVTLARTGAAGTFTLAKSTAGQVDEVDYISVSNSTVDAAPVWYAGSHSTNGGGNTNWVFTAPPNENMFRKVSQVVF